MFWESPEHIPTQVLKNAPTSAGLRACNLLWPVWSSAYLQSICMGRVSGGPNMIPCTRAHQGPAQHYFVTPWSEQVWVRSMAAHWLPPPALRSSAILDKREGWDCMPQERENLVKGGAAACRVWNQFWVLDTAVCSKGAHISVHRAPARIMDRPSNLQGRKAGRAHRTVVSPGQRAAAPASINKRKSCFCVFLA